MCDVRESSANGPCVMFDARALTHHAPVHMPVASAPPRARAHASSLTPVKPRESALIPFCNVPPSQGQARLHLAAYIGHKLPSQTNTCLFCTLCPHSCAPGNNFPVGHPSPNCSGPNTLNLGVLWRSASRKKITTCWYEYPINPIKTWAGMSHTHPLRDRRPRRSIPSQERPLLATSRTSSASSPDARALTRHAPVHMPVASAPPHARAHASALTPVRARETARVGSDTIL